MIHRPYQASKTKEKDTKELSNHPLFKQIYIHKPHNEKKTRMQQTKRIIYAVRRVQCSGGEMCEAIDRGCVGGNNI